jgi:hypothetical protein
MSFSVALMMFFPRAQPALLTRMVGSPRVERMAEAVEAMAVEEERSHLKRWTVGGAVEVGGCQLAFWRCG